MPEDGYGWEKLFSERMCRHFAEDFGLEDAHRPLPQRLRAARHVRGGREKAPAAICRKVAEAKLSGATRSRSGGTASRRGASPTSTTAIDGTLRLMASDVAEPLNVGSCELVTVNGLVDLVEGIEGLTLERRYDLDCAAGRSRQEQRQHLDPGAPRLAAVDSASGRARVHLRLDLVAADGTQGG